MRNDLFTILPPSFEPSLSAGNDGIETYLELEYQGELPGELNLSLTGNRSSMLGSKLITSIVIATTILLAA